MEDNSTLAVKRNWLGLARPVVLVGLMGAGKTTVGRRLAKDLGLEFLDADNEIVEAAGCSISDIFEVYGEEIFRDLEKRVLLRLLNSEPSVIATGGGAFMNPLLRGVIQEKAISVWLRAELDVLFDRVSRRNTRPLLEQGDKRVILSRLIHERYPVYGEATLVVDSGRGSHEAVVTEIIHALTRHLKEHA